MITTFGERDQWETRAPWHDSFGLTYYIDQIWLCCPTIIVLSHSTGNCLGLGDSPNTTLVGTHTISNTFVPYGRSDESTPR